MYFESLQAALTMEGHGGYVWSAYVATLCILALVLTVPVRRQRLLLRELRGQQRRAERAAVVQSEGA